MFGKNLIVVFLFGLKTIHLHGAIPKGEFLKSESESHEFEHLRVIMPQSSGRALVWHKLRIRQKNFHNFIFDEEFNYWLDSTNALGFEALEINFDGYCDFAIQNFEQKQYYIYEPTTHQFKQNQWLSCAASWNYNTEKSNISIVLDHGNILQKLTVNLPSMTLASAFQFSPMSSDSTEISLVQLKCPITSLNHRQYQQPKLDQVKFDKVKMTPQKFHFFMRDSVNIVLHDKKIINEYSSLKIIIEEFNEDHKVWEEYKLQPLFNGQFEMFKNGEHFMFLGICDQSGYPLFSGFSFVTGKFRVKLYEKELLLAQTESFFIHR